MCMCVCVCACVCVRAYACVRACACACVATTLRGHVSHVHMYVNGHVIKCSPSTTGKAAHPD